jgi:hypothetical protein
MLKWDHQPERHSGSWEATIAVQRRHALRQLRDNPSLQSRRNEAVENAHQDARRLAAGETELGLEAFPSECPYDWDTIAERLFQR